MGARHDGGDTEGWLLEREQELATSFASLEGAASGRGAMLVIEGPPGIGKTALLRAVRDRAQANGFRVLNARALERERELAFAGVRQLLEPVLRAASPEEVSGLLLGAARPAGRLFAGEGAGTPGEDADGGFAVLNALYWMLANLADERALLVGVDDAHWLDAPSLRLLDFLAPRIEELPLLVVVATRAPPEDESGVVGRLLTDPDAAIVRPQPLSQAGVATLIRARLGEKPDSAFTAACVDLTGGNPFYLVELLRDLELQHVRPRSAEAAAVRQIGPRNVSLMVRFRVAGSGEAVAFARALSILGDDAQLSQVAELAELELKAAATAADALARASILSRGAQLAFAHPIVRTAIYADIPPRECAAAHRRAASILRASGAPVERVATHLLESECAGDQEVVDVLRRAARVVIAQGAPDVGARYLQRALIEPTHGGSRPTVLLELGLAEARAAAPAATEHLLEAHALAADARTRAEAAAAAAGPLFFSGRFRDGASLLADAIDDVSGEDAERALELRAQLFSYAIYDPATLSEYFPTPDAIDEDLPAESPGARTLLAQLAYRRMWRSEDAARAAELAERALADGALLAELGSEGPDLNAIAMSLIWADRVDTATELLDAALLQARERGSRFGFGHVSFLRSELAFHQGALREAEADARASLEIALAAGIRVGAAAVTGRLMAILLERAAASEAADALDALEVNCDELPPQPQYNLLLAGRGRLRLERGDFVGALADLHECGRRNALLELRHPSFVPWRGDACVAQRALGDLEAARALADEELAAARDWGTDAAVGAATRLAALLSGGGEALELLREGASLLARSPARLEYARALIDLGAALRRANHRSDARESLMRGLDLADRCGAAALCRLAQDELAVIGVRPRRARLTGVDSLTASERRVAQMAASGLSNTEIAQALFVTRKTIEKHLGNAYTKLGINSRTELPAALGAGAGHSMQIGMTRASDSAESTKE